MIFLPLPWETTFPSTFTPFTYGAPTCTFPSSDTRITLSNVTFLPSSASNFSKNTTKKAEAKTEAKKVEA